MAGSFQNEIPSSRVNLKLDVGKDNTRKKMELPFKLLVIGDFTQKTHSAQVGDREKITITKNNFEIVFKSKGLKLNYAVDNKLTGNGELKVDLDIKSMDSFQPESIVKEIPDLSKLLAGRNLIKDLKSNLLDNKAFRSRLEEVMKDAAKASGLQKELQSLVHMQDGHHGVSAGNEVKTTDVLDYIFETMSLAVPDHEVEIAGFEKAESLSASIANERICAALAVFVDNTLQTAKSIEKVDNSVLDNQIREIDNKLSVQLDEILHNPVFQRMESAWRSLKFLIARTNFRKNVKIDLLDVAKDELAEDFEDSPQIIQSGLYKQVYLDEYDAVGGEPYGAMVSNYEFDSSAPDLGFLLEISRVGASCQCPFIGSVGAAFFKKNSIHDLPKIDDLHTFMERSEFLRWNSFRKVEESRYIGLVLPRFLLRLPYGPDSVPVKEFNYIENIKDKYLWGNPSFAFAANLVRSFIDYGWCVHIRGPESGGKVEDLPRHLYDVGNGQQVKIPTEILIPETREFELAGEGLIPLSFYKNGNTACFFSANSAQKPQETDDTLLAANLRINARLPYLFLVSRIAHYLKVLKRETLGPAKSQLTLQNEFTKWLSDIVTEKSDQKQDPIAAKPLKAAKVTVSKDEGNTDSFSVNLEVTPCFQVEGIDVNFSLVMKMQDDK